MARELVVAYGVRVGGLFIVPGGQRVVPGGVAVGGVAGGVGDIGEVLGDAGEAGAAGCAPRPKEMRLNNKPANMDRMRIHPLENKAWRLRFRS